MFDKWILTSCWFTLGSMVFFGSVVAPTVFKSLSAEDAGVFLRRLFPRLYLFCAVTTGLTVLLLCMALKVELAVVMGVVCAGFLYCRGPLTLQINTARDQELLGVDGAKVLFDRLHKRSVRIFAVQALVLVGVGGYL